MAAAAQSPRNSSAAADSSSAAAVNSPKSKRAPVARGVPSPWTQVVRGAESDSIVSSSSMAAPLPSSPTSSATPQGQIRNSSADWSPPKPLASSTSPPDDSTTEAQTESSDNGSGSTNAAKKPAWNMPSNGAVEVGPVMGAVSWPALSESARASPKSSSDPVKALPDATVSQGTGIVASTTTSSSSQKQVITNNTNPNLSPSQVTPTRSKPMKRGAGNPSGSVTANGGFTQPPPLGPVIEMPANNNAEKSGPAVVESSPRDHGHKESGHRGGGSGSQSHVGNDHPQRNSFRRGNGGSHPRGDGSYHHNYGVRRDQDHENRDWNSRRSFNGRDAHMHPHRVFPRGYIRPPPHTSGPFIPPPPVHVRPFGGPVVYPDVASPVIYLPGPPPIVASIPPHAMYFPVSDPQLYTKIVNQIDYYFSDENLIKDTFLRQNMDHEGWVPIELIAGFKKVTYLTKSIQLIADALRTSNIVEVQDDKRVRKRNDWKRWIMPLAVQFPTVSSPQSLGRSSHDMLATNIQSVSLEEKANKKAQAEAFLNRSFSGDLNSQSSPSIDEGTSQATVQAGSEGSISARSSSK